MNPRLTTRAYGALFAAIVITACCSSPAAQAQNTIKLLSGAEPLSEGEYIESLVAPLSTLGCADCELPSEDPFLYFLRGRGGLSYFDVGSDEKVGGAYALDLAIPIYHQLGAFASGSVNHFSTGTQFMGVLGIYKQAQMGSWGDRIGYTVLFDQYTDTRFEDMYIVQGRYTLSYLLNKKAACGLTYYDSLNDSTVDSISFLPAALTAGGVPLSSDEVVEAYVSGWFDKTQLTGSAGYRERTNSMTYGGNVRHLLGDNLAAFASAQYDDTGQWTAFTGIEFMLGSGLSAPGYRMLAQNAQSGDIVRGADSSAAINSSNTPSSGSDLPISGRDAYLRKMLVGSGVDQANPLNDASVNSQFNQTPAYLNNKVFLNAKQLAAAQAAAGQLTAVAGNCPPGFTFFPGTAPGDPGSCINLTTGQILPPN